MEELPQNPSLELVKTGVLVDGNGNGFAEVGEVINYIFSVRNTGNVTLHNVTVTDPKVTVVGGPTTLDVGEIDATTFTGSYVLTQADIDAAFVYNLAEADSDESGPDTSETTVPLRVASSLSGWVYVDLDNDGRRDRRERGIAGVIVRLYNSLGQLVATTATDAKGRYWFRNLPAGTYTIAHRQPKRFRDGRETAGTVNGQPRGKALNNRLIDIVLSGGEIGRNYNFGERVSKVMFLG
jgi:hypothetical protein